jgi:hypothetical protein
LFNAAAQQRIVLQRVAPQRDEIVLLRPAPVTENLGAGRSQNTWPAKPLCHRVLNETAIDEGSLGRLSATGVVGALQHG